MHYTVYVQRSYNNFSFPLLFLRLSLIFWGEGGGGAPSAAANENP